jgi:hypothetical protein
LLQRWLLVIFGRGDDSNSSSSWDSSSSSVTGIGSTTTAATAARAARAFRRADRIAAGAGATNICIGTGVFFITLAKRAHATYRAVAWPPGVRENMGGGTHQLGNMDVGISTKLGGAEVDKLRETEICGFVAED